MLTIDTTNICSHLQRKLFEEDGIYHHLWIAMQDDPELMAVVRSRQLHIYRNGKKVLVLAGKATPKVIREDKLCEILLKEIWRWPTSSIAALCLKRSSPSWYLTTGWIPVVWWTACCGARSPCMSSPATSTKTIIVRCYSDGVQPLFEILQYWGCWQGACQRSQRQGWYQNYRCTEWSIHVRTFNMKIELATFRIILTSNR